LLVITGSKGCICLVPVKTYSNPTDAVYGSPKVDKPIEEQKVFARELDGKKLVNRAER